MGIIKFFSIQQHKRFSMKPRFHDPEKEKFQALREKYQKESGDKDAYVPNIKGKMKKHMFASDWSKEQRKKSNMRVFIIVIAMMVIFAMLMSRFSEQLTSMMK